jgi:hypothetical protein
MFEIAANTNESRSIINTVKYTKIPTKATIKSLMIKESINKDRK